MQPVPAPTSRNDRRRAVTAFSSPMPLVPGSTRAPAPVFAAPAPTIASISAPPRASAPALAAWARARSTSSSVSGRGIRIGARTATVMSRKSHSPRMYCKGSRPARRRTWRRNRRAAARSPALPRVREGWAAAAAAEAEAEAVVDTLCCSWSPSTRRRVLRRARQGGSIPRALTMSHSAEASPSSRWERRDLARVSRRRIVSVVPAPAPSNHFHSLNDVGSTLHSASTVGAPEAQGQ